MKRLVLSLGLMLATVHVAWARLPPMPVRLGVAMDAPASLSRALEHQILPETVGHDMRLFNSQRYMAGADQLGVLWPYSPAGARRIGRAMHLTHVLILEVARAEHRHNPNATLHLRLVDVRTGRVPVNKVYALPDSLLDDATAHRAIEVLRYMLLGERPGSRRAALAALSPLAQLGQQKMARQHDEKRDIDDSDDASQESGDKASKASQTASNDDDSETEARIRHALQMEGRRQARVGLAFAFRKAQLSPQGAPCYCDNGGFAPGIVGARLGTRLFFDPNTTHIGLRLEAALGVATLPVTGDVLAGESQTLPWGVQGDVAYRFLETSPIVLVPHLGVSYSRFPISDGPFVGTGYTAFYAGTELESRPVAGHFVMRAGADIQVIAHSGLEAARLGVFQSGIGWQVQLAPTLLLGAFRLGFEARYGAIRTQYTGATALYDATRYTNVALNDATLDLQVQFGGRLW